MKGPLQESWRSELVWVAGWKRKVAVQWKRPPRGPGTENTCTWGLLEAYCSSDGEGEEEEELLDDDDELLELDDDDELLELDDEDELLELDVGRWERGLSNGVLEK